jgi:hypothetical protein
LGTPASGTVTNLTGTASININGTVGATTATTGAFTTLSATGVTTLQAGTAALPALTTSGDTNTGIFFPAADTIAFSEGGAEAMRIDSSGNVGIGTTAPIGKLDVGNVAGAVSSGDFIVTTGSTSASVTVGRISSTGSDNTTFNVRNRVGTSLFYVSPDGVKTATTISVGAATPSASGAGITFPASQSASTDPQTLDDYEEGTFAFTINFGGTNANNAGGTQTGYYTKIGRAVSIQGSFGVVTKSAATGDLTITGLPFSVLDSCAVYIGGVYEMGFTDYPSARIASGTTIQFFETTNAGTRTTLTNSDCNNNFSFQFSSTYAI